MPVTYLEIKHEYLVATDSGGPETHGVFALDEQFVELRR